MKQAYALYNTKLCNEKRTLRDTRFTNASARMEEGKQNNETGTQAPTGRNLLL